MAGEVRESWFGDRVQREIASNAEQRLRQVGEAVRSQVVQNISTSTAAVGPSRPGEFPHADKGLLRQSIFWRVVNGICYVGSPLKYSGSLERGTSRMGARPFLRRTVNEMWSRIKRIMQGG